MDPRLRSLFDTHDILVRRVHPDMGSAMDYARRLGEIEAVLPGVYALTGQKAFPEVRVAALQAYEPRAVLVERAAARFSFWPTLAVEEITAAVPRRIADRDGFRFRRRTIPTQLVTEVGGVRVTVPALTAVDLGADAIDHALRIRAASLTEMRAALEAIRWHPGNGTRRRLLEESSEQPWSAAERQLHALLRKAGIDGWRGNVPLEVGTATYVVDVVFAAQRLLIEVDGRHFHGDATFESDRWRQNALVVAGWRVLRFTWTMIESYPDRVIDTVRSGLAPQRRRRPTTTGS